MEQVLVCCVALPCFYSSPEGKNQKLVLESAHSWEKEGSGAGYSVGCNPTHWPFENKKNIFRAHVKKDTKEYKGCLYSRDEPKLGVSSALV